MTTANYKPFNRHLLLQKVPTNEKISKTEILLPDDYKIAEAFGTYRVVDRSLDCAPVFGVGCEVVVDETMVRPMRLRGEEFHLVPENYVVLYGAPPNNA